jgi:hypothetical protein
MKRFLIGSWLILSILMCNTQTTGTTNMNTSVKSHAKEDALAAAIFAACKKRSSDKWQQLYPTDEDYETMLQRLFAAKSRGLTQQTMAEMMAHRKREAALVYHTEFTHLLQQADSIGIQWQRAVFQKFYFDASNAAHLELKYLNGDIWFHCGNRHFVVEGIEAIEMGAQYKLQSVKGLRQVDDGD